MMPNSRGRALPGLLLVIGGLAVQAAAAFFWTPGTFIISAVVGAPLVVVGVALASVALVRGPKAAPVEPQKGGAAT